MQNRLRDAVSPYLRSHADNPVDWFAWGEDAFAEAERRQVPVLVSIGYSTCHWCHVMARESFSDPVLADYLNANFVAIKVDREEHPDVDSSYLAAAGAFTENLGWPLNVFVTPAGKAFFAGTYWPPRAAGGHPSFRQVLDAVIDAFTEHRVEVENSATQVTGAIAATAHLAAGPLPTDYFSEVAELLGYEDAEFGGFGSAPKFPSVPVLQFLLERGSVGDADALALASRTLTAMAGSALRDPVDGGFFRYATRRDWTEPHYERMLYDNALLLSAYTRLEQLAPAGQLPVIDGLATFLTTTLRLAGGAFASAQDSESTVDGVRVEGGYYALDANARAAQVPPALDEKVLAGWNGLAIDALALAGFAFDRPEWTDAARSAAEYLIARHLRPDGSLLRASIADRASTATATLEDYGMLAGGLLRLATATGEARFAVIARELVDASLSAGSAAAGEARPDTAPKAGTAPNAGTPLPFAAPGGADPVLAARGLALDIDPSEGAYPSGLSTMAGAAHQLYLLTAERRYREASLAAVAVLSPLAVRRPIAFGGALAVLSALGEPASQLVVVVDGAESSTGGAGVAEVARRWYRSGGVSTVVTRSQAQDFAAAGFELFEGRQRDAAYLCQDFVCRLPVTDALELELLLTPPVE